MVAHLQHTFSARTLRLSFLFLFTPLLLLLHSAGWTCAQQVGEYHIKAVFLYNLTHFVNWPQDCVQEGGEFIIGIYGPDPFGSIIDQAVSGERKYNKPIAIKRYSQLTELHPKSCNILFIHSSKIGDWNNIHQQIEGRPVLTVADTAGFPASGGMITLIKAGKKIHIEVNHSAVQESGLSMSAKLLSLARLVK